MYKKLIRKSLLTTAIAASIGLTACGGGGGGASGVSDVDVSGTAAKGIINKGVVLAEELNESQEVIAIVGNATTAVDGSYSMTLSSAYQGGPVQITVSMDADTEMKCDVPAGCGTRTDTIVDTDSIIDFAEWYKPASLTMTALLPESVANAQVSVNVTPFTHMAAERAKAATTFDAAAIASANSEVSNLLGGVDILNTAPVDITDPASIADASPTETVYAALSSALANQGLVDANGQPDLDTAIDLLADSFAAGTILADDSAGDDAGQISLQEIVSAAEATIDASGSEDLTGVIAGLNDDITTAQAGDGTVDPEASETAGDAALVKAKAMIADVRTWGYVIEEEVGTKDTQFGNEIDMASDALDALAVDQGPASALGEAMDAIAQFADGTNTGSDLSTYLTSTDLSTGLDVADFDSGTISSSTAGTIVISNASIFGFTLNMTATMPADGSSSAALVMGIQSATVTKTGTSMTVSNGLVTAALAESYTVDYEAMDLGTELPLPEVTNLAFDLDVSLTQSTGVSATGEAAQLESPVTFTGGIAFDFDPVDVQGETGVNQGALPSAFELTGTVSNSTNSMDMSLVMNVTNTDSFSFEGDFAPIGTLYSANHESAFAQWAYTDTDQTAGDDTYTYVDPDYTFSVYWNELDGSVSEFYSYPYGSTTYPPYGNYSSLAEYISSFPGYGDVYRSVDNEGDYFASVSAADFTQDGTLDGTLVEPEFIIESASNWINADIGLTFTAQLTGLPEASINITADRTGFEAAEVTTTISYGTKQLSFEVAGSKDATTGITESSADITITNQDNIVLSISDDDVDDLTPLTGTISFNGIEYGSVEDTGDFIKFTYSDGTFELF